MQSRIEQSSKQSSSLSSGRRLRTAHDGATGGADDTAALSSANSKCGR